MEHIAAPQGGRKLDDRAAVYIQAQLELFEIRCREMAQQVNAGLIAMVDAADMLHSAAIWSCLIDRIGPDAVQQTMANAFLFSDKSHPESRTTA